MFLWTLYSIDAHFDASITAFENIVGKGEIAHNKQFLLFPQYFLLNQITVSPFVHIFDIKSVFAAKFEEPKLGISGKGLRHFPEGGRVFIVLIKVKSLQHLKFLDSSKFLARVDLQNHTMYIWKARKDCG